MARNAWRGRGDGYDHEALAERPKRKSEGAAHRCAAPFPGPAAPGMAGHVPLSGSSRSEAEGPSPPARDAPGRVGSGGFGADRRWGSTPLRTDPSRPIDHFEVRGAIAVVVFDVILELRDRHIVVPTVQQGLPLLLRSVVHDDEPVREGLHRRIAVPLG